jgi:hypothetical protein
MRWDWVMPAKLNASGAASSRQAIRCNRAEQQCSGVAALRIGSYPVKLARVHCQRLAWHAISDIAVCNPQNHSDHDGGNMMMMMTMMVKHCMKV